LLVNPEKMNRRPLMPAKSTETKPDNDVTITGAFLVIIEATRSTIERKNIK